ncbi:MAG: NAD(P)-dependent alcohol dehydrogenase [Sandaracinaceae bacterium]|nr:NAD(P)-dependent alcohol dehydrogenase [Sandaracinaceae bacterium]
MKAAVYERYGPPEVVRIEEVPKPTPADDEILVRVHAASVAAGDWRMRKADPVLARLFNGLFRPKKVQILGFELAGVVEATGRDATRFSPGDEVFAFTGFGFGAHAEYRCLKEGGKPTKHGLVARKPTSTSFVEAATIPVGGTTAQAFLRRSGLRAGERLLVYGASGSVGTFAVQLGKHLGAHVTGVCSTGNVGLVESLGADEVIDYTRDDLAARARAFDVVFDAVGKLKAGAQKALLKKGGRRVSVSGSASLEEGDLDALRGLVEAGALRSVVDRTFPLEEIVEAHRYVEAGHKKGNVAVVLVGDGD